MEFCEKCGNLMIGKEQNGKHVFVCSKCGHELHKERVSHTKIEEEIKDEKKEVLVVDEKSGFETYPITKVQCGKCGNTKAYWYMQQTRSADEPPTRFYRCTKCGNSWREY